MDMILHYARTGGPEGIREPFEDIFSRISTFGRYQSDIYNYPFIAQLYHSEKF